MDPQGAVASDVPRAGLSFPGGFQVNAELEGGLIPNRNPPLLLVSPSATTATPFCIPSENETETEISHSD